MTMKNILVHVDHRDASKHRLAATFDLAKGHDAHVAGLAVKVPMAIPTSLAAELPKEAFESFAACRAEERQAAKKLFDEASEAAGWTKRSEWRIAEGDPARVLGLHGRYADLIVVGQPDPADSSPELEKLPDNLVLEAGRPVMVIPYIGAKRRIGNKLLVAWNGSREAARAVADAMPLLERADEVKVLSAKPLDIGNLPGADIALHLARHDVNTEAYGTTNKDIDIGDLLLNEAAEEGADLLVMGAYGHSRLRETILGGATRHILQHMTVPVLMSH